MEDRKYKLFQQVIEKEVPKNGFVSFDDQTLENYDEVVGYSFLVDDTASIRGSKFVTTFAIGKEDLLCPNFPIAQAIASPETPLTGRYLPVPTGLPARRNVVEGTYQDGNFGVVLTYKLILILLLKKYE
jgi:hypothetical protein